MPRRLLLVIVALGLMLPMSAAPVAAAGIVGTGTAASCTEAAFDTAFAGGGTITFNCGAAPVTITFTAQKTLTADTVIDGGGLITLSGGDTVRLFTTVGFDLTLDSLVLRDATTANNGAVVTADNAVVTIIDSTVMDNTVGGGGAAAVAIFAVAQPASVIVTGSTFTGNSAGSIAGTIFATEFCTPPQGDATVQILNSTFNGNSATGDGAVVYLDDQAGCTSTVEAEVRYSTFAGNSGQYLFTIRPGSTIEVGGNVIGPNTSTAECALVGGAGSSSQGYNVTDNADCLAFTGSPPVASDQLVANTMLGTLASNGGLTQTMALLAGSPALNTIPSGTLGCGTTVTVDQRGVARPQGTACDAGAFEMVVAAPQPTPVASLPNAAMGNSADTSPLLALGFAVLLIGSLGTLALANTRRR